MRKILAALTFAAGMGVVCCQSAGAAPASGTAVQDAAAAASPLQQAQYASARTRHGDREVLPRLSSLARIAATTILRRSDNLRRDRQAVFPSLSRT